MTKHILQDHKSQQLLKCVKTDISKLKNDVATLFSHTGRHALPDSARELADYGRDRLEDGRAFAASQLRYVREHPGQSSAGILGGLILLGAVGFGIYYLCKSDCGRRCAQAKDHREFDENDDMGHSTELPSYIS